ncbi:MAG: response regulator [Eubacteriales bacterium]
MGIRKNILIMDSDLETIKHISNILFMSNSNWTIFTLSSGKQCLDIINYIDCLDVVIVGMKLIDMTGMELIERIRDYSDIPIILLSNDRETYTLVKAFDTGANDFIIIPINKAIFIARIKALIRRRDWDIRAAAIKLINING